MVKVLITEVFTFDSSPPTLRSICFPFVIPKISIRDEFSEGESLQLRGKVLKWKSTYWEILLRIKELRYNSFCINLMRPEKS